VVGRHHNDLAGRDRGVGQRDGELLRHHVGLGLADQRAAPAFKHEFQSAGQCLAIECYPGCDDGDGA
jgi:hypothetical protein